MSIRFRHSASVAAAAIAIVSASSAAWAAPLPSVTTHETGCTEAAFVRNMNLDAVDPVVPDGYQLVPAFTPPGAAARVQGLLNVVTCDEIALVGPGGAALQDRPVTYVIYSAVLRGGGGYVVSYATDSPTLAARYRQLGWPVDLLDPRTSAVAVAAGDGSGQFAWTLLGPGWDGQVAAAVPVSFNPAQASTFDVLHQAPDGTVLHLCYANTASTTSTPVTFDLRGTPVASFAAFPPAIPGPGAPGATSFPGFYIAGAWTATLTLAGTCTP